MTALFRGAKNREEPDRVSDDDDDHDHDDRKNLFGIVVPDKKKKEEEEADRRPQRLREVPGRNDDDGRDERRRDENNNNNSNYPTAPSDFEVDAAHRLPEWLRAFVYLNNQHYGYDEEKPESAAAKPKNEEFKYLQWYCAPNCGGAGDRISGIVRSFYVALCTDRKVLVDWTQPSRVAKYLEPNLVPWNDKVNGQYDDNDNGEERDRRRKLVQLLLLLRNNGTSTTFPPARRRDVPYRRRPVLSPRFADVQLRRFPPLQAAKGRRPIVIDSVNKGKSMYLWDPYTLPNDANVRFSNNIWFENEEERISTSQCMQDYMSQFYPSPSPTSPTSKTTTNSSGNDDEHWPINNYYRTAFWTLFRWSPLVRDNVRRIRRDFNMTSHYVGLHIRTGGSRETFRDPTLYGNSKEVWPIYYRCAKSLQKGIREMCSSSSNSGGGGGGGNAQERRDDEEDKDVPIYLASDSLDVKRRLLEWDKSTSVRTITDMEVFHIDKTSTSRLDDADQAELGVWSDIKLLVDSTCVVTSHMSRFSRLGKVLSPQEPRCAINIKQCHIPAEVAAAVSNLKGQC